VRGGVARKNLYANLQVLRPSERQWKPRLRQALARCRQSGESVVKRVSFREKIQQESAVKDFFGKISSRHEPEKQT